VLAAADYGGPTVVPGQDEARELQAVREGDSMELIERAIGLATAPGFAQRKPQVVRQIVAYRMGDAVAAAEYDAHLEAMQAMAESEESFEDLLPQLEMPTLILAGEQDNVVPPANNELLAERIPNSHVVTLPGSGHLFPLEDPEATVTALVAFLGGSKLP
jgi:pimeloyl-ACP methyl ester carboxylesterase